MEIRHLKTFLTVARMLSFNQAARHLHYAQSSVSAQIQALEQTLGVRLFDRLGRRVRVTEAGEKLMAYAAKMVDLAAETRAVFSHGADLRGTLTVRMPDSVAIWRLPEVLKEFVRRFPGVTLNTITCARESLSRDLRSGLTDLAFLLDEGISAGDLDIEWLGEEQIVLAAASGHRLAGAEVPTTTLAGETVLLSRVDCSYRRLFEAQLAAVGVTPAAVIELNSVTAIVAAVAAGVGISPLPAFALARDVGEGRLAVLDWSDGPLSVGLLMIRCRQAWLSPSQEAFMTVCRRHLAHPSS